jgi:RNA polymerase sigma-70 factor (ECF subfamily)
MPETIFAEADNHRLKDEESDYVQDGQISMAGYKRIYVRWLSPVYRYFYSRIGNSKDAEDLTSQVFLKVYEDLPRYRERGLFSAWLFTIVRNKAIDFFRTGSREISLEISLEIVDPMDETPDLLTQTVRTDEIRRLRDLIRCLPEEERELIRLRFVVELRYREIGVVLNRKEDAIRKSITRLLDRLENQLETSHE